MITRWLSLLSASHVLILSSLFTSGVNFAIFVIYPTLIGTDALDAFIRNNYAGGFYLFGIASSVSIIATKIISTYNWQSLIRYLIFSFSAFLAVILFFYNYTFNTNSILCVLSAFFLHLNGFMLAVLIRENKITPCFYLQIIQPLFFLVGISLSIDFDYSWVYSYSLSVLIAFIVFLYFFNLNRVRVLLLSNCSNGSARGLLSYQHLLLTLISSMSFPLFFQVELFFVGEFTTLALGEYTVLQKMYSSVSVALFSGVLVHLYGTSGGQIMPFKKMLKLPLLTSFVVSCVAIFLNLLGKDLSLLTLLLTVITSYIFSIAMFASFAMSIKNAKVNIYFMAISLSLYLFVFQFVVVSSIAEMLGLSLIFYSTYVFIFLLHKQIPQKG